MREQTCWDIGNSGECGPMCPVFINGKCNEPYEFSFSSIVELHTNEELVKLLSHYPGFLNKENNNEKRTKNNN